MSPRRTGSPGGDEAALSSAWWAHVLAGDVDEPHPLHGSAVQVRLRGTRLRLAGELESEEDRDELVTQARSRIGKGIGSVDVADLKVAHRRERRGILDQTMISAFPNRAAAEFARDFVIKHSRVVPQQHDIVDATHSDNLRAIVPADFTGKVTRALDTGLAVLVLRVDETAAFRVREILDEETRSQWTVAMPPVLASARRQA
jgi:hypothetical protein